MQDGKILFAKRRFFPFDGYWSIPGGHCEQGESPLETARREVKEELGEVEVSDESPLFVFTHNWPSDGDNHTNKKTHKHRCHVFRARVVGELDAQDDVAEVKWMTPKQARHFKLTNYTETILNHIVEKSM